MGLGQCDYHKNLMDKLPPHAKQCRWLMQIELTFNHKLVLDSLHSHDLDLERNHHPFSL
jgi:hypothetical protein